jgi:hypothetical protein
MQLVVANVLGPEPLAGAPKVLGEPRHQANVIVDGVPGVIADAEVVDHTLT